MMAYAPAVLELSAQLAAAEAAFDRRKALGAKLGDLTRRDPACAEQCDECSLECAIMSAIVEGARRELASAIRMDAPTLKHGGRYFVAAQGSA